MLEKFMSPEKEKEFFQDFWEKSPMIICGEDSQCFESILSDCDIDHILTTNIFERLKIHVWEGGSFEPLINPFDKPELGIKEAYLKYGQGIAVEIRNLKECCYPVRELCSELERNLWGINTFGSSLMIPRDVQPFSKVESKAHTFFLQVSGKVSLKIFKGSSFDEGVDINLLCNVGDFIYIPSEHRYEVSGGADPALSLLLSFENYSWQDFIESVFKQVSNNEKLMSERIPLEWLKEGTISGLEKRIEFIEGISQVMLDPSLVRSNRNFLFLEQIRSSQSLGINRLQIVNEVNQISLDSFLKIRKEFFFFVFTDEENSVWFIAPGQTKYPLEQEEEKALEFFRGVKKCRVKDIPEFGDPSLCLNFARLLLSLGVAEMEGG
jgi:hypothetical protein